MPNLLHRRPLFAITCLVISLISASAEASVEIDATDSGWYRNDGWHSATNRGHTTGVNSSPSFRNFLVFDLSSVSNTILSGVLKLENPQSSGSATYKLFDVSTAISTLTASHSGAAGVSIYGDLGTGTEYGSAAIGTQSSGEIIEVPLNAAAIAALNSATGLFAFGGALQVSGGAIAQAFLYTTYGDFVRTLSLEVESNAVVPEPHSVLVWGALLAVVASVGVIARQKTAA